MIKIHPIETGQLRIRRMHRYGLGWDRWSRLATWMLVPGFAAPIPMRAWLIDHPDGPIVVDTGETLRAQDDPEYFPPDQRPFFKLAFRFQMTAADEIGPQLLQMGFQPEDIQTVVLTHAHMDHSDGLHHFPNATVFFSRREWHDANNNSRTHGAVTARWPSDMTVEQVDYVPEPIGPFQQSFPLTKDGRVRIVPTPGHTMGHQSIVVQADDLIYFIAGDVSFTEAELFSDRVDGVTHSAKASQETRQKIREWATSQPIVYLPSHDPDSPIRLKNKQHISKV
ncbi:MAG: N-acyl homoserine lactonase family protein [Chloroflexi bacterium]|nr:N-acyl homoserine lactonase family protein [Chloroflexota bacterium]